MKNNILSVTVGIPAYNEGKNILFVLNDVFSQNQNGWKLKEILVYSDGSTDNTVTKVTSLKNSLIKINKDTERKGQIGRIQEMFHNMKGEVLVMIDADLRLKTKNVVTDIVTPFKKNKNTMLVGANTMAYSPKTFFQRAVYSTFKVFYASRLYVRAGNNVFGCTGCLAIRNTLSKQITFPKIKNQDAYMYFFCKAKQYSFVFVKSAIVYYKLPNNLSDYLSQVFRSNPEAVQINLKKHFGDIVEKEFFRGHIFYAKTILKVFFEDPLPTFTIIIVNALCKPLFPFLSKSNKTTWRAVTSTK